MLARRFRKRSRARIRVLTEPANNAVFHCATTEIPFRTITLIRRPAPGNVALSTWWNSGSSFNFFFRWRWKKSIPEPASSSRTAVGSVSDGLKFMIRSSRSSRAGLSLAPLSQSSFRYFATWLYLISYRR